MDDKNDGQSGQPLESRIPTREDLIKICKELNRVEAKYLVIGGFAMIRAGMPRTTMDIDLLIDTNRENESRVKEALCILQDKAALEIEPGEIENNVVVRIADEIVVDLMGRAGGLALNEVDEDEISLHTLDDVTIPFAAPKLLWKLKIQTHREKDAMDLAFLKSIQE